MCDIYTSNPKDSLLRDFNIVYIIYLCFNHQFKLLIELVVKQIDCKLTLNIRPPTIMHLGSLNKRLIR